MSPSHPKKLSGAGNPDDEIKRVSGEPDKAFFVRMLTRDIDIVDAILDLLDNCVDGILRNEKPSANEPKPFEGFWAEISFDGTKFEIDDNCGGIPWPLARDYAFRMGPEDAPHPAGSIGTVGIGMKRAMFKMGQHSIVHSHHKDHTFEVVIPPSWFEDKTSDNWDFQAAVEKPVQKDFGTSIVIREDALNEVSDYTILAPFFVTASDYGAATIRRRVLFFGYRSASFPKMSQESFLPMVSPAKVTVATALTGLPVKVKSEWITDVHGWRKVHRDIDGSFGERCHAAIPSGVGHHESVSIWQKQRKTSGCIATIHEQKTIRRFDALEPGETDSVSRGVRLDPNGYCPTLRAGTGSDRGSFQAVRPIHPTEPRVITPREAARLQGFPDWFRFDPTKWHSFRQIGNSVSPILAEKILLAIREKLKA